MAIIQVISWAIIEVRRGALGQYGNHQETINRRPEQMYTSSNTKLECSGRGHYSSRAQINAGGQMGPLFESAPGHY